MKCAKCGYLGFETGDRCRNCGFDFSLLAGSAPESASARPSGEPADAARPSATPDAPDWLAQLDQTLGGAGATPAERPLDVQGFLDRALPADGASREAPAPVPPTPVVFPGRTGDGLSFDVPPPAAPREDVVGDLSMKTPAMPMAAASRVAAAAGGGGRSPALPLFGPPDDEPPAQLRAVPRPPIAVRRTPDTARVRALVREAVPPVDEAPALQFADPADLAREPRPVVPDETAGLPSAVASRRLLAAGVDAAVLGGLGLVVTALTLRMLDLPLSAWRALPGWPMGGFLGLLAFAYLCTFTAVGGQTVGKMVARVRVVTGAGGQPSPAVAARRAAASLVSAAVVGLGFVPALVGRARLALHDRVAGTRVVDSSPS